jgi:5,5'-dehydrodivanillate O-demethylase oxygenase subunit
MLTEQENERLSRVGPGTPMGELLRRYWHPIATVADVEREQVLKVRRLGEDLVLYRSRKGEYGLIQERCPHRSASLAYGIPHEDGIRCAYHGWLFNGEGSCLEQPFDDVDQENNTFKDKIRVDAYPVETLGGLVFAYMGPPEKKPLLPRWQAFATEGVNRNIGISELPCNWLQCMENSLDPVHFEWLHANLINFVAEKRGEEPLMFPARHVKIAFDEFEFGIYKRRLLAGDNPETSPDWLIGHPIIFPNMLGFKSESGGSFQIRVPIDDEHTWHLLYSTGLPKEGEEPKVTVHDVPWKHDDGRLVIETVIGTDMMAWVTQGPITPRQLEHVGVSDRGILLYRQRLSEAIDTVARGEDAPWLIRDEAMNYPMLEFKGEDDLGAARSAFRVAGKEQHNQVIGAPEPQAVRVMTAAGPRA